MNEEVVKPVVDSARGLLKFAPKAPAVSLLHPAFES